MAPHAITGSSGKILKNLAKATGVITSGKKIEITNRLVNARSLLDWDSIYSNSSSSSNSIRNRINKNFRVLSIDLGLKNLAHCVLDVQNLNSVHSNLTPLDSGLKYTILDWKVGSLCNDSTRMTNNCVGLTNDLDVLSHDVHNSDPNLIECLANDAYEYIWPILESYSPNVVVIERQLKMVQFSRFSSSALVTITNLEAMLHSIIRTVTSCNSINLNNIKSFSVPSNTNAAYWNCSYEFQSAVKKKSIKSLIQNITNASKKLNLNLKSKSKSKSNSTYRIHKESRQKIVENWMFLLNENSVEKPVSFPFDLETNVLPRMYDFLEKYNKRSENNQEDKKIKKNKEKTKSPSKLDDLSDCLLQGLAWIERDLNRFELQKYFSSLNDQLKSKSEIEKDLLKLLEHAELRRSRYVIPSNKDLLLPSAFD